MILHKNFIKITTVAANTGSISPHQVSQDFVREKLPAARHIARDAHSELLHRTVVTNPACELLAEFLEPRYLTRKQQ